MKLAALLLLAACSAAPVTAQQNTDLQRTGGMHVGHPAPPIRSPRMTTDVFLNGKKIHISFGAPNMRGRKIMGDLVPYNTWWRTGADEATTFENTGPVMVGSLHVPAGKYTLVTIPSEGEWQLVICKHTGQFGENRYERDDLGKVPMKKKSLAKTQERMSINFQTDEQKNLELHVKWETTDVYVPITFLQ